MITAAFLGLACAAALVLLARLTGALRRRGAFIWLPAYVGGLPRRVQARAARARLARRGRPVDVLFMIADHFEPGHGGVPAEQEAARVAAWLEGYPRLAERFTDADGRPPRHTWFFPPHYNLAHLGRLNSLVHAGLGEIELHLHHGHDTPESLAAALARHVADYHRYGALLTAEDAPRAAFAFVHGNWSLNNAGGPADCGVNDELKLLAGAGCFADFTLPSGYATQTRTINAIYYACSRPDRPKGHDRGTPARVGGRPSGDLLLIQGPLGFHRRWPTPRIENASLTVENPATAARVAGWVATGVHVVGRPEWVFVKLHAHGAPERDWPALFGEQAIRMHETLQRRFNDGRRYRLHYVTAREAYNIAKAAEAGHDGDAGRFRDFLVPPYVNTRVLLEQPALVRACGGERLELAAGGPGRWAMRHPLVQEVSGDLRRLAVIRLPDGAVSLTVEAGDRGAVRVDLAAVRTGAGDAGAHQAARRAARAPVDVPAGRALVLTLAAPERRW